MPTLLTWIYSGGSEGSEEAARRGEQLAYPGELWARMLLQFGNEYKLVLRLVAVALIVPADTSECERIFSLMNNIKTVDRARMGQRNLKNLMLWHEMGKELEPEQVPVMAILKEFRTLAGPAGRKAHRAANPITYEYEKHRIKPESSA